MDEWQIDPQAVPEPRSAAPSTASTARLFAAQQAALREVMSGMDAEARWVLLIGEHGSGKSTVIRALLEELRLSAASVALLEAPKTAGVDQLANGLREQLGLPHKRKLIRADRSLADIVASQAGRGTPLVVIVDDANALSMASIEWLARLAARGSRTDSACYVVLAGTPALDKAASRAWSARRSGNTLVRSVLGPMTPAEIHRYVGARSHIAADTSLKFSEAALERLEAYSKGRPGLLADLCARAMKLPTTRITNEVSGDAVTEAAERLALGETTGAAARRMTHIERGPSRLRIRQVGVVVASAVLTALFLYLGIRVGLRLMETTTVWLASEPARDRSGSDVVRPPSDEIRREPEVSAGLASGLAASVPPSTRQRGEQRSTIRPERAVGVAPSAGQVPPAQAPPARQVTPVRQVATAPSVPSTQQIAVLMARAREGELGELTRLMGEGVSPNVRDVGGFTPLMAAVVNGQLPAARLLLDRGADVNARAHGDLTALMLAIINDRHEAVKLLLDRGADVNAQSGAGWTALTFAVWKSDAALERVLLDHGARPNVIDKQGWRPVEYSQTR